MAPLVLEGDTLGKRHENFNKLVNEAISKNLPFDNIKLLEEKSDIDKLFKIDLAANSRNVLYILETLNSEDLLYVSRAIKQSSWLITDNHYAHIVNPHYMHDHLFPLMTSKAKSKFLLQVRLLLKEENRVEEFFKYYEDKDLETALKWLPRCSRTFIEKSVEKHCSNISINIFKRLCERYFCVFEIFNNKYEGYYYDRRDYLREVMFLLHTDAEKYLDVLESKRNDNIHLPKFGIKYTEVIMKKCPERFINNFSKYAQSINIATFAKYLGKDNIKDFLLKQVNNPKLRSWFKYENIKPFITLMPKNEKFDFIKRVFINREEKKDDDVTQDDFVGMCAGKTTTRYQCYASITQNSSTKSIYQWYRHAPFDVALPELKKLIRTESSPEDRISIMAIMLTCAGSNMNHIKTVLQYYHDRHINEPFKYKVQFINNVISTTNTHRYDQKCWKILDELFHSMDVYIESDNNVQNCVVAVILYKLVHDEPIPQIIEKKFNFVTFNKKASKLDNEEKQKIFLYLYKYLEKKINEQTITNQDEFNTTVSIINQMLDLLIVWKKEVVDYPYVLNKMKYLVKLKQDKSWTDSVIINSFYDKKSLRKYLFEESLFLSPSQEVFLNALKHDPQLLKRYPTEVDILRYNDNVSLTQFLNKLKIYFPESLADEWIVAYRSRLQRPGGHKAVARGLCTLLTQEHVLDFIKQYAPANAKIMWSEADGLQLSLQKQIAMSMHIARPQPSPDAVLLYAKGDYLQYALPSLTAIFYNISAARSHDHIPKLIDAPVSIQKHGIRLAFEKLTSTELKDLFSNVWKSTKNASIRAVIFALTIKLLCKESELNKIEQLWQLLEIFIDNLTEEENRSIYNLLGNMDFSSLPPNIQGKFCKKSYTFLKALPAKLDCENLVQRLALQSGNLMDTIDADFVKNILLEYIDKLFVRTKDFKCDFNMSEVVGSYIIKGRTEEIQKQRYEAVLVPIMRHCFARWDLIQNQQYVIKSFLCDQLDLLGKQIRYDVFTEHFNIPVNLFKLIVKELENSLSITENYLLWRRYKLKIDFIECLDIEKFNELMTKSENDKKDNENQWAQLCLMVVPEFGKKVIDALNNDIDCYFRSIYDPFSIALESVFVKMYLDDAFKYSLHEFILSNTNSVECYLVVLSQMTPYLSYMEDKYKAQIYKLHSMMKDHPSEEVKIHYRKIFDTYGLL